MMSGPFAGNRIDSHGDKYKVQPHRQDRGYQLKWRIFSGSTPMLEVNHQLQVIRDSLERLSVLRGYL